MRNFALVLCLSLMTGGSNAYADEASMDFLESLDGKFRGRGLAVLPISGREERVSCQINNAFDEASRKLSITGRCATTQGKMEVNGELIVKEDGNFEGVFISPSDNMELKESQIDFTDDALTISTVTYDIKKDKTFKAKQIVKLSEAGKSFSSAFELFSEEKNAYQNVGTLEFKSNGK